MFPTTRVPIIERLQQGGEDGKMALGEWWLAYFPAMRGYVMARFRQLASDSEDIVSQFVTGRIVDGPLLKRYSPRPGKRFRGYLRTALFNYCISELRRRSRQPGNVVVNEDVDAGPDPAPDVFDILWARQILGRALRRMRVKCASDGSGRLRAVWGIFEGRFLRPYRGKEETPYPALVERYGFSSPPVAQTAATDGKKMLVEALRSVVSEYSGTDDVESELEDLWRIIKWIHEGRQDGDESSISGNSGKE